MRVRLTLKAARQIAEALDYIAERSPNGAANVRRRLDELLDLLQTRPGIGPMTDRPGVRRLVVTPYPYLLDYRITGEELIVLRFRHGARHP